MPKLDELLKASGGNMDASMGVGRVARSLSTPPRTAAPTPGRLAGVTRSKNAAEIAIDRIIPDPDQPRKEFTPDKLEEMAASLLEFGQIQPCTVRYDGQADRYVIVTGERRYRGALAAGLGSLACMVDDEDMTALRRTEKQLVENLVRDDLKPLERARTFKALKEGHGWTYKELAARLKISAGTIHADVSLLDLPVDLQARVESGELPKASAAELARVENVDDMRSLAEQVMAGDLDRSDTARAVRESRPRSTGKRARVKSLPKGKSSPPTRTFRTTVGIKITAERGRGVEASSLAAALREVLAKIEGEFENASDA